jgi:hypothetical protein
MIPCRGHNTRGAPLTYLKYEIGSGQVTKVTADEILRWFEACFETPGDVWERMNHKDFFFGSRERIYANEKSVKQLGLTYFDGGPYFIRPTARPEPAAL